MTLTTRVRNGLLGGVILALAMAFPVFPAIAHPGHGLIMQSLSTQSLTPELSLTGLGVAFLVGSSHALAPGHGKTMVAAYLVGSRGTPQHALLLGLVTTVTHTLGVFTLGLLTLAASQYVVPDQLYPIFSLISGIMICGVGFWLLDQRLRSASHLHEHFQDHSDEHFHEHIHTHDTDAKHSHSHHHSHSSHAHLHPALKDGVTLQSLIALGIAGGLVPCPSALVLLLSAIALHQVVYGLLLVSVFSLGLAFVLSAIGISVVYAQQWFTVPAHWLHDRLPWGQALIQAVPILSAIVVIVVGAVLSVCAVA